MIDIDVYNQLMPNPLTMAVQLLSTLVIFLVVRHYLWASIKDYLARRSDKMQEDLDASEKARAEALADRDVASQQLKDAAVRSEEIVNAAVKEAKTQKDTILAEAGKEADALRKKAHDDIEAERREMYGSMKKEMIEVAMAAAEKLLEDQDGVSLDRQAVDAFVKEAAVHGE